MAYGSNLLINPSAETQDTTGWTVIGVTVAENQTVRTTYDWGINDAFFWLGDYTHRLIVVGPAGDYHFVLEASASMEQVLYASDIGSTPNSFQFIASFQIPTAQNAWDPNILAKATARFDYTDGYIDFFQIPLVKGITHKDRNLINFWLYNSLICDMDTAKNISQITVSVETLGLTGGILLDYIELRKEV